jgi:hypothetical protein
MHGGRVGKIIRGHIDGLDRGYGPGGGIADPLFQFRQFGAQGRLVPQARRQLAHESGDFHAGLDETKDIVDQEQHVLLGVITEILSHGEGCMAHAEPGPRRFIHLPENHYRAVQYTGRFHLPVQIFPLTAAFADAAKQADALMTADDVMNHLHDQHRFSHTGTAEQTGFPAPLQGRKDIDGLDAGKEDFRGGGPLVQRHRHLVDGPPATSSNRIVSVDGLAEHIEHPSQQSFTHGNPQWMPRIDNHRSLRQALGGCQRNPPDGSIIQVGDDFNHRTPVLSGTEEVVQEGQTTVKPGIHHTSPNRYHFSPAGPITPQGVFDRLIGVYVIDHRPVRPFLLRESLSSKTTAVTCVRPHCQM